MGAFAYFVMKNKIQKFIVLIYVVSASVGLAQIQTINTGASPNMEDGDSPRQAWVKQNANNQAMYSGANMVLPNFTDKQIQDAFSAANAVGGVVRLLPGADYSLSTHLFFTNGTLDGQGAILHWTNAAALLLTNYMFDVGTNPGGRIEIKNVGFDGGIYPAAGWNSVTYYDSAHLIPNGFFGDTFWSNRTGIRIEVSKGAMIKNCFFEGWSGEGLLAISTQDQFTYRTQKLRVVDCCGQSNFCEIFLPGANFETPGYAGSASGLWALWTPHYSLITGCIFADDQQSIVANAANCTVSGNQANNDYFPLVMNGLAGDCLVMGNNFNHATGAGVLYSGGNGVPEVLENRFLACTVDAAANGGAHLDFELNYIGDGALNLTNNSSGKVMDNRLFFGDVWGVNITTNLSSGFIVSGNIAVDGTNTDGSALSLMERANRTLFAPTNSPGTTFVPTNAFTLWNSNGICSSNSMFLTVNSNGVPITYHLSLQP